MTAATAGTIWQVLVFSAGVLPPLFAVTGFMIWLRSRKAKRALGPKIAGVPQVDAAEQ